VYHPDSGLPWSGQYLPYKQALNAGLQLALACKKKEQLSEKLQKEILVQTMRYGRMNWKNYKNN
jgi:hypothetical protein